MDELLEKLQKLWNELYGNHNGILQPFLDELEYLRRLYFAQTLDTDTTWYQDAIVYSTYADLFNHDLNGLKEKFPYMQ